MADPTKSSLYEVYVGRATPSISLRAVRLSNGVPARNVTYFRLRLLRGHTPRLSSTHLRIMREVAV
jgi:hypothetical protein